MSASWFYCPKCKLHHFLELTTVVRCPGCFSDLTVDSSDIVHDATSNLTQVTRCGMCKFGNPAQEYILCTKYPIIKRRDWFCADGQPKSNITNDII